MLKKIALLGLFSTVAALSTNSAAQAAILWNWSFGGTETVRFTTTGNIADLSSAGTFNITDFQALASSVPSLVGANFNNDPSTLNQGVQGFQWDGTQITQVFRNGGALTNGANFYSGGYSYTFAVGFSNLNDPGENSLVFASAFTPNPSPAGPTQSVPEPSSVLALLGLGLGVLATKGKKQA